MIEKSIAAQEGEIKVEAGRIIAIVCRGQAEALEMP